MLGEVPEPERALREILASLKPGGVLSITEMLPDPDYQPREALRRLVEGVGFRGAGLFGNVIAYTANFARPREDDAQSA